MVLAASLLACSRKPAPTTSVAPAAAPVETSNGAARPSTDGADAARRDSIARAERLRAEREAMAAARVTLATPIYFSYDESALTSDARRALDAKLPLLRNAPAFRLRIGGHADERGSDEYNLALGQRRASTVKQYLVDQGVQASQLETVSYGEERPVCSAEVESCWSRNRRAEFEILEP
jgi:peptidoglycan-associated lipoprotein